MMSRKGIKVLGLSLVVMVLGGFVSSCKGTHEVCPAYTKGTVAAIDQEV